MADEKRFEKIYHNGGGLTPLLDRDGKPVVTTVANYYGK